MIHGKKINLEFSSQYINFNLLKLTANFLAF
jgi:hypothetical protein